MPTHTFRLNGQRVSVDAADDMAMLWVLRDKLGVTGPKYGCGVGVCRACTSHLDGQAFQPCTTPVAECAGREVTTIEGLADGEDLHPVQQAWLDLDVAQCGYCQPGQIMAAAALLATNRNPSDADIDGIENICRCGTYVRIRQAIKRAGAALG
jgi:isoquinoline 1-oxidoreductase alpha subunit